MKIYLNASSVVKTEKKELTLGDCIEIWCDKAEVTNKLQKLHLVNQSDCKDKYCKVSIMNIIQLIYSSISTNICTDHTNVVSGKVIKGRIEQVEKSEIEKVGKNKTEKVEKSKTEKVEKNKTEEVEKSEIEIINMGETEVLIKWQYEKEDHFQRLKTILVSLVILIGSSFAIMSFNEDVAVESLFQKLYSLINGSEHKGYGVLEFMYGVGIAAGIVTFFNHYGNKKMTKDPTPIELKMSQYEDDVNKMVKSECDVKGECH